MKNNLKKILQMLYTWIELQKTENMNIFLSISNQYFQVRLLRSILCKPCIRSPSFNFVSEDVTMSDSQKVIYVQDGLLLLRFFLRMLEDNFPQANLQIYLKRKIFY